MQKYYFFDTNTRTVVNSKTSSLEVYNFIDGRMQSALRYLSAGSWLVNRYVKNNYDRTIYFSVGNNEYVKFDKSDMWAVKSLSKPGTVTVQRIKRYGVLAYAHKDGSSYPYNSSNTIDGNFPMNSKWAANAAMLTSNYEGYFELATDIFFFVGRSLFENGGVKSGNVSNIGHFAYIPAGVKYYSQSNTKVVVGQTSYAERVDNPSLLPIDGKVFVSLSNGYFVKKDDVCEVLPHTSIITTCTPFPKVVDFEGNAVANSDFDMGQQMMSYGFVENGDVKGFLIDNNTILDTTDTFVTTLMNGNYFEGVK